MSRTHLWTTLAVQFKASPGKTGALSFLALVLLMLVVRQLSGDPRAAEAVQVNPALIPEAGTRPGMEHPAAPARRPRPPLPELPDRASRDLFHVDWLLFARVASVEVEVPPDEAEGPVAEAQGDLALELTLTSSAKGGQPYAVISGQSVRLGDAIGRFVVESISPGEVILSTEGRGRIVLRMH